MYKKVTAGILAFRMMAAGVFTFAAQTSAFAENGNGINDGATRSGGRTKTE